MTVVDRPPASFANGMDQLHARVSASLGSDCFGPADYLPGLAVLLQSMDYDPHFTETGRHIAWDRLTEVLAGRAQAYASMAANPGFDAHTIIAPVVITGVPRTGTTALHRLMAVDPRFQGLQTWLLDAPMPRPPIDTWADYPQFRASVAALDAHYALVPDARAAHFRAAEEVHECCMLLRQSFVSNLWIVGWSAASYDAWWQSASEAPAYAHFHRCVQLIGSNDRDKRWLLKNPGHIAQLDLLFAIFPDARIIQTHRDPAKAVASLVSLLMKRHDVMESGRREERARLMMRREVGKWAQALERADAVRAAHSGQVLDVVHADLHNDAMAVIDRIYAFIGMDLPDDIRAAMQRRAAEKPELARGEHHYAISDFGMSEAEAREPFGAYVDRFNLLERGR